MFVKNIMLNPIILDMRKLLNSARDLVRDAWEYHGSGRMHLGMRCILTLEYTYTLVSGLYTIISIADGIDIKDVGLGLLTLGLGSVATATAAMGNREYKKAVEIIQRDGFTDEVMKVPYRRMGAQMYAAATGRSEEFDIARSRLKWSER